MKHPLALHLKAALICALVAMVLALPVLWVPLLPAWQGWRPPVVNPRAEAILAVLVALWVAWCVVDIPRRGLKVLIWLATLWLGVVTGVIGALLLATLRGLMQGQLLQPEGPAPLLKAGADHVPSVARA